MNKPLPKMNSDQEAEDPSSSREACMPAGRYEQLIYIIHVIGSYK